MPSSRVIPIAAGALVVGSTYGLTISRPIVQSSTWHFTYAETLQFPYPATVTWVQLAVTYALLLCLGWLIYVHEHGLTNSISRGNIRTIFSSTFMSSNSLNQFIARTLGADKITVVETVALAISTAAATYLSVYTLSFAPLEIFLFWRSLVIPVSMVVARYFVTDEVAPSGAVFPATLLYFGSLMTAYRPNLPQSQIMNWTAVLSSLFAAIWPFQLSRALQSPVDRFEPKYQTIGRGVVNRAIDSEMSSAEPLRCLQNVTLLAVLLFTPLVLSSGELGQISRNCYFLKVPNFWIFLFSGAAFRFILIISSALFIRSTSSVSFIIFMVLTEISQIITLAYSNPLSSQWFALVLCLFTGGWLYRQINALSDASLSSVGEATEIKGLSQKRLLHFMIRGAALIILLASFLEVLRERSSKSVPNETIPIIYGKGNLVFETLRGMDAYLGTRPHVNTVANLSMLINECRGTYGNLEHIYNGYRCLNFLSKEQDQYLSTPGLFSDNIEPNSSTSDPISAASVANTSESMTGTCEGPIVPYHIWWTGLPTWRIELFIKSYFYTQNTACSKLWIWVNTDLHPDAMDAWLHHPRFQRLMPLVTRGDIILKEWKLPSRVPLPVHLDELDKRRYYSQPRKANFRGERFVADFIIRDSDGREWVQIYQDSDGPQLPYYIVAVSDAARIIILHLHGGVYMDPDMLLLRDLRPLLLSGQGFAERWGTSTDPSAYNNGVLSIPANSTLSSYLLLGGKRMGLVYHFLSLGRMLFQEGRDDRYIGNRSLVKLENAFFDPMWVEIDGQRFGRCSVPCIKSFEQIFKSAPVHGEWESFEGEPLKGSIDGNEAVTSNRTLENFYRGAYAIHLHNLWNLQYEPGSWIDTLTHAHDNFFAGEETNGYGELWEGPKIKGYLEG